MNLFQGAFDAITGLFRRSSDGFQFYHKRIGTAGAQYLDTTRPYAIYNMIPQFKTIVNRKAAMFSNMKLILVDQEGAEVPMEDELKRLLENPNVSKGQNEFLFEYKIQEQVYGNQFIYKNKPSGLLKYPIAIWNMSPAYLTPVLSGKVFQQIEMKEIIPFYQYQDNTGKISRYETETILYSRLVDLDHPIIGCSPIVGLNLPLSNTKLAYDYRNIIMGEKGAIGILSNNSKDAMGAVPLTEEERDRIEGNYVDKYGIGNKNNGHRQQRVILTEASLNWQPMSYPTKDLLLHEEVDANFLTIVDALGLNSNIFSSKSATFENVKQGIILSYQDTIFPEADNFTQALTPFLGVKPGLRLKATFDHVPILQTDRKQEAETMEKKVLTIVAAVNANILSPDQAIPIVADLLKVEIAAGGGKVLDRLRQVSPLVANQIISQMTPEDTLALLA